MAQPPSLTARASRARPHGQSGLPDSTWPGPSLGPEGVGCPGRCLSSSKDPVAEQTPLWFEVRFCGWGGPVVLRGNVAARLPPPVLVGLWGQVGAH